MVVVMMVSMDLGNAFVTSDGLRQTVSTAKLGSLVPIVLKNVLEA